MAVHQVAHFGAHSEQWKTVVDQPIRWQAPALRLRRLQKNSPNGQLDNPLYTMSRKRFAKIRILLQQARTFWGLRLSFRN
ncbi:hypothetical protein HPB48_001616 [Haemaphysalis longicornis]|uniref:Uncharacterized protein n=1 Tax=Haemaphysalis longicornis TaxID=44386 RepID=A0A9J6FAM2_HAELO|nr:hypothetical protein HPB48_001616 [Haemaphysalis longicornis]